MVDPPKGIVPIWCNWIFKKKISVDKKIETFEARFMEKAYRQRQRVEYKKIFSLAVMIKSIKNLLVIAKYYDHENWKIDVKAIFLAKKCLK